MTLEQVAKDGGRSLRIVAHIPLTIELIRESFSAVTAVINNHGALILSHVAWASGTILEIRNQRTNRSTRARVVWTGPDEGHGYKIGVEFEVPESGFWGMDYSADVTESPS